MGGRCDHSVPQSETHGHPDLDLWLQTTYSHTCTLQVSIQCCSIRSPVRSFLLKYCIVIVMKLLLWSPVLLLLVSVSSQEV